MKKPAYRIEYSPEAEDHLAGLTARQSTTVLDQVLVQLSHEPTVATRNRKLLRANELSPWELRIDNLRVYYEVADDPERLVVVKAVGIKRGHKVFIGGLEVVL